MYMNEIDDELEKKLNEYKEIFEDVFPLMQFDGSRKDLLEELDKCIKTKIEYDTSFWDENPDCDS